MTQHGPALTQHGPAMTQQGPTVSQQGPNEARTGQTASKSLSNRHIVGETVHWQQKLSILAVLSSTWATPANTVVPLDGHAGVTGDVSGVAREVPGCQESVKTPTYLAGKAKSPNMPEYG